MEIYSFDIILENNFFPFYYSILPLYCQEFFKKIREKLFFLKKKSFSRYNFNRFYIQDPFRRYRKGTDVRHRGKFP